MHLDFLVQQEDSNFGLERRAATISQNITASENDQIFSHTFCTGRLFMIYEQLFCVNVMLSSEIDNILTLEINILGLLKCLAS